MADSLTDSAREAAKALITAKRDELLREQKVLTEQRADILARLRRNDRELADCRAAARLFQIDIEFPPDERDMSAAERAVAAERMAIERHLRDTEAARSLRAAANLEAAKARERRNALAHGAAARLPLVPAGPRSDMAPAPKPPEPPPPLARPNRPPLREVVLEQLRVAGDAGAKAAPIRDYIERTYGEIIHEKTVGMTLYRLSQAGLVRRDGHNWFYVPQETASAENPGAATPGPINAGN